MTDSQLVKAAAKGDEKAFSQLVERHYKALTMTLLAYVKDPEDARDICQQAILKAYERLSSLLDSASFKSWLYRIAINAANDHLKKKRKVLWADNLSEIPESREPSSFEKLKTAQQTSRVREAIDKLPEKQRIIVALRIYEDMDYRQISQVLTCEPSTARANFFHAIKSLKRILEDEI